MKAIIRKLEKYFFREQPAVIICSYRFLYCGILLFLFIERIPFYQKTFSAGHCTSLEVIRLIGPFQPNEVSWMMYGLVVSLALSALGFFSRVSLLASFLFLLVIEGVSIGCSRGGSEYLPLDMPIVLWNFLLLALAPGVNRITIISLFGKEKLLQLKAPSWGVELIKFTLIFAYFASGVAKIREGFSWLNGYTLQWHLLDRYLYRDGAELSLAFANVFWLCLVSSWVVVGMELSAPLAYLGKRATWFILIFFLIFQLICFVVMDLRYFDFFGWVYLIYFLELYFKKRD